MQYCKIIKKQRTATLQKHVKTFSNKRILFFIYL